MESIHNPEMERIRNREEESIRIRKRSLKGKVPQLYSPAKTRADGRENKDYEAV